MDTEKNPTQNNTSTDTNNAVVNNKTTNNRFTLAYIWSHLPVTEASRSWLALVTYSELGCECSPMQTTWCCKMKNTEKNENELGHHVYTRAYMHQFHSEAQT